MHKAVDYAADSYNYFSSLSPEMQVIVKSFSFKYGKEDNNKIGRQIILETEQISAYTMETNKEEVVFNMDIPWNLDQNKVDYNSHVREFFLP
jgi:hypothetical protein